MRRIFLIMFFFLVYGLFGQQKDFIKIDGGTFTMGSPANERGRTGSEGPQHQVTVSSFLISKYEVTQAEYEEIMGKNPSHHKGANLPVEQVSWFDAIEYCNKRSVKEGLTPAYTVNGINVSWDRDANGYRLPTEAEWEYACRAGTQTPFYSGASADDACWHSGNSGHKTHPVGEKQPNSWELYDMHGNVLEWCWDWLGNYSAQEQTDPLGAASGTNRVYRGGCWSFQSLQTRSAYRFGNHPNLRSFIVGFRLVRYA
ncbi:MAG: formylglycine-generating enzyme family protein [Treponema sp.]|nr:formylglycine-generating enzyme family protein [Treponema sp.]